jgi:Rps23 Pro-64 3,4-dihydroxylase Tpa1-like proline 4-hydroxylase
LLNYIRDVAWDNVKKSTINKGEYKPNIRQSYDLSLPKSITDKFSSYISNNCEAILSNLNMNNKRIGNIDISLRAYGDGHFFRLHTDRNEKIHRLLSVAYFFYFKPKEFQGGDLLLFDSNLSGHSNREFSHNFTRIIAKQNTLAIFPSASYHAVSKIQSNGKAYNQCRYAVNAHIWENNDDL